MKKIIYISILTILPFFAKAQLSIDSFVTQQNFTQDTVTEGTLISFNVEVLYGSSTPFTGTIYLISGVDSSAGITSIDTVGSLNVLNLINGSVSIPLFDTVNTQNGYRKGGDIIVIWPVASGLTPIDTFKTNIWVEPIELQFITDVETNNIEDQISIYPNPIRNELFIKNNSNLNIDNIMIVDFSGKVLYNQIKEQKVNVSKLIKGSYLIQIELGNKQKLIYRLIKTN